MTFKRHNRMPAYIWGSLNRNFSLGWCPQGITQSSFFAPYVPLLPSSRKVQDAFGSTNPRPQDDSPCDSQLPWRMWQMASGTNGVRVVAYGLTINGELYHYLDNLQGTSYAANNFDISDGAGAARRLQKTNVSGIGKPIKKIAGRAALDTDGRLWQVSHRREDSPTQFDIPGDPVITDVGVLMYFDSTTSRVLVAVDEDGDMYWQRELNGDSISSARLTKFSQGCVYMLQITAGGAYANGNHAITFAASPTGDTATGYATATGGTLTSVTITNQGSGYVTAPAVTIAGAGGGAITCGVFTNGPFKYMDGWAVGNDDRLYYLPGRADGFGVPVGFEDSYWKAVAADAQTRGIGIQNNGKLYAWGYRWYGNNDSTPAEIGSNATWNSVAICVFSAVAVKSDYTLWTWGLNIDGTLGDSTDYNVRREAPAQVASDAEWISVWSSYRPALIAIRKDAACRSHDQPMEYWPDSYFA